MTTRAAIRATCLATILTAAGVLGGCTGELYRVQPLGTANYDDAFVAARTVMAQYFSVASADPATGRIVCRPKSVAGERDRLLGTSAARQTAEMRVRRMGGEVYVDLRVETQRQDLQATRRMQPVTVDNDVPSRTTIQQESAALDASQDQAWVTTGRDHEAERAIMSDLLRRLEKPAATAPSGGGEGSKP